MQRSILYSILAVLLVCFLTACGGNEEAAVNEHEDEALTPAVSEELVGKDYTEVVRVFRAAGFTNIKETPVEDLITGWMTKDGEVESVTVDGSEEYASGVWVPKDTAVEVTYHTFKEEEDAVEPEETEAEPESGQKEPAVSEDETITSANNAEFARIISDGDCSDFDYSAFAAANIGRIIEFDGSIDYVDHYKDYDTRFDILLSAGPYDENHQIGPTFKFENVAVSLIETEGNAPEYIQAGQNVRIKAVIEGFNENAGLFFLDPVLLTF